MKEKKDVQISLGTAICIFIIILLIIALIGMWWYYNKMQNNTIINEPNKKEQNELKYNTNTSLNNVIISNNSVNEYKNENNIIQENNENKDKTYVGTWNTQNVLDSEGKEDWLVLGSYVHTYGSKLILNEDGTFEDAITIHESIESSTGKWELKELQFGDKKHEGIELKYNNGNIKNVDIWESEDEELLLIYDSEIYKAFLSKIEQ